MRFLCMHLKPPEANQMHNVVAKTPAEHCDNVWKQSGHLLTREAGGSVPLGHFVGRHEGVSEWHLRGAACHVRILSGAVPTNKTLLNRMAPASRSQSQYTVRYRGGLAGDCSPALLLHCRAQPGPIHSRYTLVDADPDCLGPQLPTDGLFVPFDHL